MCFCVTATPTDGLSVVQMLAVAIWMCEERHLMQEQLFTSCFVPIKKWHPPSVFSSKNKKRKCCYSAALKRNIQEKQLDNLQPEKPQLLTKAPYVYKSLILYLRFIGPFISSLFQTCEKHSLCVPFFTFKRKILPKTSIHEAKIPKSHFCLNH